MPSSAYSITAYTFNPGAGTVTFTGLTVVDASRVLGIYDTSVTPEGQTQELGTVLYVAEQASQASVSGNVLTLPSGSVPPDAQSTDSLHISYDLTPPHGWQLLSFANHSALPASGVSNTWYLAADTGQVYVWDGSAFVAV